MRNIFTYLQHSILALVFLSFAFISCDELEEAANEINLIDSIVFDTTFVYDTIFVLDSIDYVDSSGHELVGLWDLYSDALYIYDTTGALIDTEVEIFTKELDGPTDTTWATIEFKEPTMTDPIPRYETRDYDFYDAQIVYEYGIWFVIGDSLYVHDEMNPNPDSIVDPFVLKYYFNEDTLVLEARELYEEGGSTNDELGIYKLLRRE